MVTLHVNNEETTVADLSFVSPGTKQEPRESPTDRVYRKYPLQEIELNYLLITPGESSAFDRFVEPVRIMVGTDPVYVPVREYRFDITTDKYKFMSCMVYPDDAVNNVSPFRVRYDYYLEIT